MNIKVLEKIELVSEFYVNLIGAQEDFYCDYRPEKRAFIAKYSDRCHKAAEEAFSDYHPK